MNDAWPVVVAALGSAILTILGTFWLAQWRLKKASKAAQRDRLREACTQMASHAMSFAIRSHVLYQTSLIRSGFSEGLDVALYHRKPVEPIDLADWLFIDLTPLLDAYSQIRVMAGEEVIRAADQVFDSVNEVVEVKSRMIPGVPESDATVRRRITLIAKRLLPLHTSPEQQQEIEYAIRHLGKELRRFAYITRKHLGIDTPDAVIRILSNLMEDPDITATEPHQPKSGDAPT